MTYLLTLFYRILGYIKNYGNDLLFVAGGYVHGAPANPQSAPVLPTRQTVIKHTRESINVANSQVAGPVSTVTFRTESPSPPETTSKSQLISTMADSQTAVQRSREKKRNIVAALNTNLKRVQDSNTDFEGKIANLKYHLLTYKTKEKVDKILAPTASILDAEKKKLKDYHTRQSRLARIPALSWSEKVNMTPEEKHSRTLLTGKLSRDRRRLAEQLLPQKLQAEESINLLLRATEEALKSLNQAL